MNLYFNIIERFKDFATDITINDTDYDLHNDFKCLYISFDLRLSKLTMDFKHRTNNLMIHFTFNNAEILKYQFKPIVEELIVDQIYRGDCMDDNSESLVKSKDKGYFYISFIPDFDIELMAESITIVNE